MGLFSMFSGGSTDQANAATNAGGLLANYAQQAGDVDKQYIQQALSLQNQQYLTSRNDLSNANQSAQSYLSPFRNVGLNALDSLADSNGVSRPTAGSLTQNTVDQYNTLRNQLNQIQQGRDQNEVWWRTHQSTDNVGERDKLQGQINSSNTQIDELNKQISTLIGSAPDAVKSQLQQNNDQYNQYLSAQRNNALYNVLDSATGNDKPHLDSVRNALTFEGQSLPTGLMDVKAPAPFTADNSYTGTNGSGAINPLTGFSQSGQAAVIGGYDPNKSSTDNFHTDPGYQFALDQGQKTLERSAASRGLLESGAFAKDLTNYGQGMADQQYDTYLNRLTGQFTNYQNQLSNLTGLGSQASSNMSGNVQNYGTNLANVNTNYGNQGSDTYQNLGASQANSLLAQGNALATGMTNAANVNAANQQANSQMGSYLGSALGKVAGTAIGGATGGTVGSLLGGVAGGLF